MYKAKFDFTSKEPKALSFRAGDQFTVIEFVDKHWCQAQNGYGQVGFVPNDYIEKDEVAVAEVVKSIDRAIENIHHAASASNGNYSHQQRENLQKLILHRKNVIEEHNAGRSFVPQQPRRQAPAPPQRQESIPQNQRQGSEKRRSAPPPPTAPNEPVASPKKEHGHHHSKTEKSPGHHSSKENSPKIQISRQEEAKATTSEKTKDSPKKLPIENNGNLDLSDQKLRAMSPLKSLTTSPTRTMTALLGATKPHIPDEIGVELVEMVRKNTNLSHEKCQETLYMVLDHIKRNVPSVEYVMDEILKKTTDNEKYSDNIENSHDAQRLSVILSQMAECKDDSQQRSWALHEDEAMIKGCLEELISILSNANQSICRQVISRNHFEALDTLVLYYQMETRVSIRLLLLKSFGALCNLEARVISELLTSVLAVELARDLQTDLSNTQKFCFSSLVLTMLFSMGEPLPVYHYEQLNQTFIEFIFDQIENPHDAEMEDEIADTLTALILSFNLHIKDARDNVILKVLAERGQAKVFTEKVMMLMNSGDDPVKMFDHEPRPDNSVLKFLCDLYCLESTSDLLYTNDAKVLIDVVIRHLCDLSPGNKMRSHILNLMHLIMKNSSYCEHEHRKAELQSLLMDISKEEDKESEQDRWLIRLIWKDLPQYFGFPTM
ncbi:NCK-interacting protein with SH3 domain-like [Lineus longissimus]|uniref:NCK-interacting protein with SH3 domain-like n=1 Tax=Lineus longissimus TaxID=88925 RepID=UPI002B4F23CB